MGTGVGTEVRVAKNEDHSLKKGSCVKKQDRHIGEAKYSCAPPPHPSGGRVRGARNLLGVGVYCINLNF